MIELHNPLVYVVVLTWNHKDDTLACLESLSALTYPNFRVLVVDNGSTDGTPEAVRECFPTTQVMVNERNLGFAAGFNAGIRRALRDGGELILLLNNDMVAASDFLEPLVAAAPEDVGAAPPLIFYADAPDQVWSAGSGRDPVTLELNSDHGWRETLTGVTERDFLSGCALLIKRAVFERVGLFDERFCVYYEDSDYCLRIR